MTACTSFCVPCLPKQITFGNALICPSCSETTPPSPVGLTQLHALPDIASEYEALSTPGKIYRMEVTVNCDDCVEDERAGATCLECKMNLLSSSHRVTSQITSYVQAHYGQTGHQGVS